MMRRLTLFLVLCAGAANAGEARDSIRAFNAHCFTKGMTLDQANSRMRQTTGTAMNAPLPFTLEFYDTTIAPAPDAKPGTDRRCKITFNGAYAAEAEEALLAQMATPPVFGTPGDLPPSHAAGPDTTFIQGRDLPLGRCAVVEVTQSDSTTSIGVDRIAPGACE